MGIGFFYIFFLRFFFFHCNGAMKMKIMEGDEDDVGEDLDLRLQGLGLETSQVSSLRPVGLGVETQQWSRPWYPASGLRLRPWAGLSLRPCPGLGQKLCAGLRRPWPRVGRMARAVQTLKKGSNGCRRRPCTLISREDKYSPLGLSSIGLRQAQ